MPSGLRWVSEKIYIKCLASCKRSVSVSFFPFLCMELIGYHLGMKHRMRPEVHVCVSLGTGKCPDSQITLAST